MLRLHVTVLLSLFSLPALASEPTPTDSTASRPMGKAEVVIVHFGDSTCITSYLPAEQRVEAVLNDRLSKFYRNRRIISHNVAAGGDYIRPFLDTGRYEKVVKDKIPHIDIALIRYGHNHPNANGVKIIADEEFKTITGQWPERLPTAQ